MAEWFKAAVLKTVVPKGTGGSNPSSSATPVSIGNYIGRMRPLASLACAATLLAVGPAPAAVPPASSRTFVLSMTFDREYLVGGKMPTNLLVRRNTGYRVHVTPKADGTATAVFYNRMGRRMGAVPGVVEAASPEARNDIPADLDSKTPWTIRTDESKTWIAIGGPGQRQVLFQLFDPPAPVIP